MKKLKKNKRLNKKIKHMSMYICLLVTLIIIIPVLVITLKKEDSKNVKPDNISTNLQGMARIDAQTSLINIIKKYLEDTPNIKNIMKKILLKILV